MTLQEAKTRLDEAMNWHQFGPNHDEDSWCCERENELRDEVLRLEAVGGDTATMSTHAECQYQTCQDCKDDGFDACIAERVTPLLAENTRLREALRTIAENTQSAQVKFVAEQALAAGKGERDAM